MWTSELKKKIFHLNYGKDINTVLPIFLVGDAVGNT